MIRRRLLFVLLALGMGGVIVATLLVSRRPAPHSDAAPKVPALGEFSIPNSPAYSASHLRPEVTEAVDMSGASSWSRRTDLIRKLPFAKLNADEVEALLFAMVQRCPAGLSPGVHSTYMHEIACILEKREDASKRLAVALAALARDTQRDDSIRDYAIQHLREVWRRAVADSALRASIVSTFHEFAGLDPYIATPSLLSLHLLGNAAENSTADAAHFHFPDVELIPFLNRIFAEKTTAKNIPSRLTAVRIVAERRIAAFRESLFKILKDDNEMALVRMASANAIGRIANPEDIQILSSLKPADVRVASALNAVLLQTSNN